MRVGTGARPRLGAAARSLQAAEPGSLAEMSTITSREVLHFLESVFGGMGDAVHELLASRLARRALACGEVLWAAGDPADAIAFVVHGRLHVRVVERDGDVVSAGEVGRGQAVGVADLVGRQPRVSTVTAMRASELLILGEADFEAIVAAAPAFVIPLMRGLATRLSATRRGEQGYRAPETVTLLPLDRSLPLAALGEGLARALARLGSVHLVDADLVDRRLRAGAAQSPIGGADEASIGALLDDLDDAHDVDLYLADPEDTPWTRRCLARADRIVVVAPAGGDPAIRPIERLTDDDGPTPNRAPRELLVVHPAGTRAPVGTAAWLARRSIERLHHVRVGQRGDLARVARRLVGRALSLVLSGGAARGMCHIGVIRGLLEAGVPIDAVGGASAGGGVGVLLAAEFSVDEMVAGITDAWLRSGVFTSPKVPIVSLFECDAVREGMVKWIGDRHLEDLWRDCYVVATNLTRARLEVIDRGLIWHALLSTAAIPGILPPTFRAGDVLVDGGVLDNLPLAVMRRRNPGQIIASDVGDARDGLHVDRELLVSPSNARLLFEKINPFDENTVVPTIAQTLFATISCSSRLRDASILDDVLHHFVPDLTGLPALSFNDPKPLLEAGYRAAVAAIEAGIFDAVVESAGE